MDPEIYYSPVQEKQSFKIKKGEILQIAIAWIGITLAFSWKGVAGINTMLILLPIVLVGTLTGFIIHELAHKFFAMHYGCYAEFKLWLSGLGFAIILSLLTSGAFVFAAPGAVYIWGKNITRKQNGIISIAGPVANLILAIIFLVVGFFATTGSYMQMLFFGVYQINLFLGGFNMLPIPPLDGFKVFAWNKPLWIILFVIFVGLFIFI